MANHEKVTEAGARKVGNACEASSIARSEDWSSQAASLIVVVLIGQGSGDTPHSRRSAPSQPQRRASPAPRRACRWPSQWAWVAQAAYGGSGYSRQRSTVPSCTPVTPHPFPMVTPRVMPSWPESAQAHEAS